MRTLQKHGKGDAHYCGYCASTIAAKMNRRPGIAERSSLWVWIPREGFVRWSDIERAVDSGFRRFCANHHCRLVP